jgi:hypothetical protein
VPRLPSLENNFGNLHLDLRLSMSPVSSPSTGCASSSRSTPFRSPSPATRPVKLESRASRSPSSGPSKEPSRVQKGRKLSQSAVARKSRNETRKERTARIKAERARTGDVAKADREFEAREKLTRNIGSQSAALRRYNSEVVRAWKSLKANNIIEDKDLPADDVLRHNKEHVIDTGTLFIGNTPHLDKITLDLLLYSLSGQDHIIECLEQCMLKRATPEFDDLFRTLMGMLSQLPNPAWLRGRL